MSHEVAAPLPEMPSNVDRALPPNEPDHLRHRVLRRDRDHHVYVVRLQVPFLDLALLLTGQAPEYLSQMPPELSVEHLPAVLRDEDHVVLTLPFAVL